MKTLVLCSGGLDSVSLAYAIAEKNSLSRILSFNYGQRHIKELKFAELCSERLRVPHHVIDMSSIGAELTGSALTDEIDVPDGHYEEESMRVTVVPNRNAIMLAVAFGVATANSDEAVATAVHGGDHYIYPDCRPGFTRKFEAMQKKALHGIADIKLITPFINGSKADIVKQGLRSGTPFKNTWSCYKGRRLHCGRCGTCVERREAFHIAGVTDPTIYEDDTFWLGTQCEKGRA